MSMPSLSEDIPAHHLPVRVKAGYGAGQIAGQIFRDAPSLLLLFYLTNIIGIAPAIAGAAIFVPKVGFGIVFDLGIGILSDRVIARFPRRRWLLVGAIMAPVAMVGMFAVPPTPLGGQVTYVVLTFSIYMMAFSTFSVPYLAQFAEITDDPAERTVLMAWRHGFTGLGVLIGSSLIPILISTLGGGRMAYIWSSVVLAVLCSASLAVAWRAASHIRVVPAVARTVRLRDMLAVLAYRPFLVLCLSSVAQTVGAGMSYASFAFFVSANMQRPDAFLQIGIISFIMAAVVIAGSPIWVIVARRLGKKNTYLLAAIGHAAVTIAWGLSATAPLPVIYCYAALLGLFNSGWGLIVLSLLADAIARSRDERGQDRAGSFSALWSIIEKAGIALGGTLLTGLLLSVFGFSAAVATHGGAQPASALQGIALAWAWLPAALKLVAAAIVWIWVDPDRPATVAARLAYA